MKNIKMKNIKMKNIKMKNIKMINIKMIKIKNKIITKLRSILKINSFSMMIIKQINKMITLKTLIKLNKINVFLLYIQKMKAKNDYMNDI